MALRFKIALSLLAFVAFITALNGPLKPLLPYCTTITTGFCVR